MELSVIYCLNSIVIHNPHRVSLFRLKRMVPCDYSISMKLDNVSNDRPRYYIFHSVQDNNLFEYFSSDNVFS